MSQKQDLWFSTGRSRESREMCKRDGKQCEYRSEFGTCDFILRTKTSKIVLRRNGVVKEIHPPKCELYKPKGGEMNE